MDNVKTVIPEGVSGAQVTYGNTVDLVLERLRKAVDKKAKGDHSNELAEKIESLKQGILPIYEPGLEELVERNVSAGRLHFTTSYSEGLDNCDFIFIAVNTPTGTSQGGADMRYVESAARGIAKELDHSAIIINKSTVPVGSGDVVTRIIRKSLERPDVPFAVVSNPEFLREGSAV